MEKTNELSYKIDLIKNTGFNLVNNVIEEIDEMLKFCKKEFGDN